MPVRRSQALVQADHLPASIDGPHWYCRHPTAPAAPRRPTCARWAPPRKVAGKSRRRAISRRHKSDFSSFGSFGRFGAAFGDIEPGAHAGPTDVGEDDLELVPIGGRL